MIYMISPLWDLEERLCLALLQYPVWIFLPVDLIRQGCMPVMKEVRSDHWNQLLAPQVLG
jgi:hypothetical protein